MRPPTYAAARTAADRIHRYFGLHPISTGAPTGTMPSTATLAALIDAAFWTSLRREEIYSPRISLAFVASPQVTHPVSFATPISLVPRDLTKLAGAVERSGIHLCVWPTKEELQVWGIARQLPPLCLVLEIVIPGLLVVKQSPLTESGKFLNVAVLQGDEIKIIEPQVGDGSAGPALLASHTPLKSQLAPGSAVNVLLQLAVSIRAHGRGGMLLVVPDNSEAWTESILHPIMYRVTPPFHGLADLMRKNKSDRARRGRADALARAVDGIAGLTAVDGATVMTGDYHLLAFGAKIVRRRKAPYVSRAIMSEPIEGSLPVIAEATQLGGTRHLAAAQFVHDQRDTIALVASQDGRFTVFGWSPDKEMVYAHRIDVLLL
jgi:hypothetical protein